MDDRPIEPNDPPPLHPEPNVPYEPTGPEPINPAPISPEVPSVTEVPTADGASPSDADNTVQDDEGEQAQTIADQARFGGYDHDPVSDSERVPGGINDDDGGTPDLVDHMNQMVTSGRIDMDAFRGERNDDDAEYALGEAGEEDEGPRGAE